MYDSSILEYQSSWLYNRTLNILRDHFFLCCVPSTPMEYYLFYYIDLMKVSVAFQFYASQILSEFKNWRYKEELEKYMFVNHIED